MPRLAFQPRAIDFLAPMRVLALGGPSPQEAALEAGGRPVPLLALQSIAVVRMKVTRATEGVVLVLLTPFAFMLGAEPFEARGRTSLAEVAAGCVAVILYLAFCQYRIALKAGQWPVVHWNMVIAMGAPMAASTALIASVEKWGTVLTQGLPMLLAGSIGVMAGALPTARRRP